MLKIHTGTLLITIAVVLGGALTLLALCGWKLLGSRFEDETPLALAITEVRVVGGGSGNVEIRPGAIVRVNLHRDIRYLINRPGITYHVEGTVLYIDTAPDRFCVVSYVVDVPEGVRVSGELGSGELRLAGVSEVDFKDGSGRIEVNGASGMVRLETGSGGIILNGVTGDITAKSSSGSITGRELQSTNINATTRSGGISLDLVTQSNVNARTSSGDVNLTVPDDRYRINTKVSSGSTHIKVVNDPASVHHLDLYTDSGDIIVAPR